MCGRYALRKPAREIVEAFDVPEVPELPARFNIAPTQDVPVVRMAPDRAGRQVARVCGSHRAGPARGVAVVTRSCGGRS